MSVNVRVVALFCFNTFYGISPDGLDDLEADGEDGHKEGKGTGRGKDPRRECDAIAKVGKPVAHDVP